MRPYSSTSRFTFIAVLIIGFPSIPGHLNAQMSEEQQIELATLDAAATGYGTIGSWIRNDPEAAIAMFQCHERIREYLQSKLETYKGIDVSQSSTNRNFALRIKDRVKQMKSSLKDWDYTVPKFKSDTPKQIATELKRQDDAVERHKKSKSPRPSSFAYIPKTVWQTKNKLEVLKASGVDTRELEQKQVEVQQRVLELLKTLDKAAIAKSNGYIRDAYKKQDRNLVENFVQKQWAIHHPDMAISKVIMPKQSWEHTYSVHFDATSKQIEPLETERMTVYVSVQQDNEIVTLYPIRLARQNFKTNGKVLGKTKPGPLTELTTNEFPFDVLAKNIR